MKHKFFILIFIFAFVLFGCKQLMHEDVAKSEYNTSLIKDAYGKISSLPENPRVVSCYSSFTECWLLSGGELVGVTDDAVKERELDFENDVEIVGTVKDINFEKVVSLNPDYVILSADIAAQASIGANLELFGIKYGYFRVDNFDDYSKLMRQFCDFHKRDDLFDKNVAAVESNIKNIIQSSAKVGETYLLMRVYSTGIKVKTDNIVDTILKDLGCISITDSAPSLLNDLSVEEVIQCNPKYIFVLTMGDEIAAEKYFSENILNNPAWSGLSAINEEDFFILPKKLFHYKPNNRWDHSYKYIADLLYQKDNNDD